MKKQVTILGLDQIGASIGLALAAYQDNIIRYGHDPDSQMMKKAEKAGAVDKSFYRLSESVRDADLVILNLSAELIQDTLEIIGSEVKPETVIINTIPIHAKGNQWVEKYLPNPANYLSALPVINPRYLTEDDENLSTPHEDLFENGSLVFAPSINTSSIAIQYANDLAVMLRTAPFIVDETEIDGMLSRVEQLPEVVSLALLGCMVDQPGWMDNRHATSRTFYRVSSAAMLSEEKEFLGLDYLLNQANVVNSIDRYINELQQIRQLILTENEDDLKVYIKSLREGYNKWKNQRTQANWNEDDDKLEISGNIFSRLFGGKPKPTMKE